VQSPECNVCHFLTTKNHWLNSTEKTHDDHRLSTTSSPTLLQFHHAHTAHRTTFQLGYTPCILSSNFTPSYILLNFLSINMARSESPHLESRVRTQALCLLTLSVTKLATQRWFSKLFTQRSGVILFLNFCIKYGDSVTLAEANTLRFIAQHTTIPVPTVHHTFTHHGKTYILMERIRGETIAKRWRSLSDTSKASIFGQLIRMVKELRSIPSETTGISNVDGGPIYDSRLPQKSLWGPFDTIHDFHLALRNNVTYKSLETQIHGSLTRTAVSDMQQLVTFHESVTQTPVLTHGELSSFNILIREDKVVGIIDWETAGWLPYYWEYTTAWHANPQNLFWQKEVDNFLDSHEVELGMEKLRRMYFGEL
jgi:aminoglycoside phosphotransferase